MKRAGNKPFQITGTPCSCIMLPETARMKYGQPGIKKCIGEQDISREDMLLLLSGVLRMLQKHILSKEEKINGIN